MKTLLIALLSLLPLLGLAQQKPQTPPAYQLSTHILDINKGLPAPGVKVRLSKFNSAKKVWEVVAEKQTDDAGRISDFLPTAGQSGTQQGIFKLTFQTKPYFKAMQQESFYPFIEVVFELTNGAHYHVPITLSAFGYSTYRGS
ncbi:hydroxyisourate hydrolase [Hymenobacter aerophilus]|uniref:hydroxyisourate hydrolase n=1 Tax=Hymenobacter aerophilus TaxID=119644 RepID=UPI00036550FD|nr:hydroxyisourate hydrolase [Hymenobacter aerophilus]